MSEEPCPWCGKTVPMRGYRTPAEHPCDFSLVCGAPTPVASYERGSALAGRCRNPRSESDGRCYAHSTDPVAVERRRSHPPGPKGYRPPTGPRVNVAVVGAEAEALRQAAAAAGVTPATMVHLLIQNHLSGVSR